MAGWWPDTSIKRFNASTSGLSRVQATQSQNALAQTSASDLAARSGDTVVWTARQADAPKFGAYYPTYGAMPVPGGAMFLFPGDASIQTMHVVPVQVDVQRDRQRVWAEYDPFIRQEGWRWWQQHGGTGAQDEAALWAWVDTEAGQKGCPDPGLLSRYRHAGAQISPDERNRVLGWTLHAWRSALQAQIQDARRQVPYLPFVPAERQVREPVDAAPAAQRRLAPLTPERLKQEQARWAHHPMARVKLAQARPGDFFGVVREQALPAEGRYWISIQRAGRSQAERLPDPWSVFQPQDVHGPSQLKALDFPWSAPAQAFWNQPKHLGRLMLTQIHIGTYTPEGTYRAALEQLKTQKAQAEAAGQSFGLTGIQLNPLAEFAGHWNWGYDGTYYFAPENAYGPPEDLQALVNWCHENDLAVIFDLVLNHFGPEGNYLGAYGGDLFDPYGPMGPLGGNWRWSNPETTEQAKQAVRFWVENFHADGIRFDLSDQMPDSVLRAISQDIHAFKPNVFLIYEDYRPSMHVTLPPPGGAGAHLQYNAWGWEGWKHFLEPLARHGGGDLGALARSLWEGLRGHQARPLESAFNYLMQHDVLGNDWRARLQPVLSRLGGPQRGAELARLAQAVHVLMPGATLAFQGEETSRQNGFNFFTSFFQLDTNLGVLLGRGAEAKPEFEPGRAGCIGPASFEESKLHRDAHHADSRTERLMRAAMALRQKTPALWQGGRWEMSFDRFYPNDVFGRQLLQAHRRAQVLMVHRTGRESWSPSASPLDTVMFTPQNQALVVVNFSDQPQPNLAVPFPDGPQGWTVALDSDDPALGGTGQRRQHGIRPDSIRPEVGWVDVPARSMLVLTRGSHASSAQLAGAALGVRTADGGFAPVGSLSAQAKDMLRQNFAVL